MNNQGDYYPIEPDIAGDINEEKEPNQTERLCCQVSCWILQILLWMFLILTIVFLLLNYIIYIVFLAFFLCIYIFYFILELWSTTAKFLCNKNSDNGLYEKMGKYFRTPPEIKLYCECYHMGYGTYSPTDIREPGITYKRRIITHFENLKFSYYSERDVSGLFYLNCDPSSIKDKSYIKLELEEEINFADTISYMDYFNVKKNFCDKNRKKDSRFYYKESRFVPQISHHNLIKLRESEPCTVNYFFFLLATFLTLAELYKPYVNSFCLNQKFKIRKIVSTRYDLSQPEYEEKYKLFNPSINLIEQSYNYQPQDYNFLNKSYKLNLPTQKELQQAEIYKDQIPNYQVSNGEGQLFPGVIMDGPPFVNYVYNQVGQNNH